MIFVDACDCIDFFNDRNTLAVARLSDLLSNGAAPLETQRGLRVWRH